MLCVCAPLCGRRTDSRTLFTDLGRIPACVPARSRSISNTFGAGPSRTGGAGILVRAYREASRRPASEWTEGREPPLSIGRHQAENQLIEHLLENQLTGSRLELKLSASRGSMVALQGPLALPANPTHPQSSPPRSSVLCHAPISGTS